jgi:hypothetical protein
VTRTQKWPAGQNAVMSAVPPTEVGKASGLFNTARELADAFGVSILAAALPVTVDTVAA